MSSGPLTGLSKGMSTATSSNSHCASPGDGSTASAPSTTVLSSAGLAGLQMRVATRDMRAHRLDLSKAVLIAGPTASGKSALALELAQKTGGIVVNADSMQVYRDLRIITARPTVAEEARVPHRLYGHVDASVNFSAGAWVADAEKVLADARAAGARWRRGAACRTGAPRSGLRRTAEAARPHPDCKGAGSRGSDRPHAAGLASRGPAAAAAARPVHRAVPRA